MLSALDLIAILLALTAAFAWINHRFIGLPHSIGLLVMGLGASLVLVGIELAVPSTHLYGDLAAVIRQIDFQAAVLNGVLAFLLFAGALHVDLGVLRDRAWAVGSMAIVGTLISTAIVGIRLLAGGTCARDWATVRLGLGVRRPHQPDRPARCLVDLEGGAGAQGAGDRHDRRVAFQRRRRRGCVHGAGGGRRRRAKQRHRPRSHRQDLLRRGARRRCARAW